MAYATLAQLAQYGLPATVLATMTESDRTAALDAVSSELDEALRAAGYGVPLGTHTTAISRRVCEAAAYHLLCVKGFQPDEIDGNIRARYDDFLAWKEQVAQRRLIIVEQTYDATPTEDEFQPLIFADDDRGW